MVKHFLQLSVILLFKVWLIHYNKIILKGTPNKEVRIQEGNWKTKKFNKNRHGSKRRENHNFG